MRSLKVGFLTLFVVFGVVPSALAGLPYPGAATPKGIDRGALTAHAGATPISVTLALSLPQLKEAESLLVSLHTPGSPQYHQFLTADDFVARFAPTEADVAQVVAGLAQYGLSAERTTATTLKVTGLPADMERAFAVSLHTYEVPAQGKVMGYTFHAPLSHATIPPEISAKVAAVVGLDSRPALRPRKLVAPPMLPTPRLRIPPAAGNPPGQWTVTDFANYYDVTPLYKKGVSGKGRTIGIVTLASFTPSDAFTYWTAVGLKVNPNRLTIVNVDGGPGAPSDASGSDETTLDVEQSGGIAPSANIILYQAPNTNQGSVDMFATAIDANLADSISTSWGFWEWEQNLENSPVTDPATGKTVGVTQATHELLVRAAIQGQTVFAASGDGGAYDINHDLGCPGPFSSTDPFSCSLTLTVDYRLRHDAVIGRHHEHHYVRHLRAARTHPRERFMARRVHKNHASIVHHHFVRADMLRNAASFAARYVRLANRIEQARLAVVHVAHHRHNRRPRLQTFLGLFLRNFQHHLFFKRDHAHDSAERFRKRSRRRHIQRLVDAGENAPIEQRLQKILRAHIELFREFPNRDAFRNRYFARSTRFRRRNNSRRRPAIPCSWTLASRVQLALTLLLPLVHDGPLPLGRFTRIKWLAWLRLRRHFVRRQRRQHARTSRRTRTRTSASGHRSTPLLKRSIRRRTPGSTRSTGPWSVLSSLSAWLHRAHRLAGTWSSAGALPASGRRSRHWSAIARGQRTRRHAGRAPGAPGAAAAGRTEEG